MTTQDRVEVREMFTDILSGPLEKINGQNRVIMSQLANIEAQTIKTNGKVAEQEKIIHENLPHTIANCAQKDIIVEIRDNMISAKAVKSAIIISIASTGTVFMIFFIIYQIFVK